MVSLKNIITHILQNHDFDVFEKDGLLYGEKEDDIVTVGIYEKVTVNDIRSHASTVSEIRGRHILCIMEAGDPAQEEARRNGLILWKRSDLEQEIGQAIQFHISDSSQAMFKDLVTRVPDNALPDSAPLVVEAIGTEGTPIVLKSQLTQEDVKEIAANTIQGFKHDLELVPHYVFHYSCTYEGKDGQEVNGRGIIAVNALTGKYSGWDSEPEFEKSAGHHVQLEPKIDEDNAIKIAVHAVAQLNTEFKEIIVERDHATIIEKAIFKPDEDNIILERQTLVMVPVWCVEGKHGVMILDGITGKVISEDYYDKH